MPTYAAFLRGMNLGKHRRITNADLCTAVASIGFDDVHSFRASGNVAFTAARATPASLERRIEEGLQRTLGYAVPTYVRTAAQMREIVSRTPFSDADLARSKGKLQVALLKAAPGAPARKRTLALSADDDRLALDGSELYWLPRGGLSESELDLSALEAIVGAWTMRTMGTLEQMTAKLLADA